MLKQLFRNVGLHVSKASSVPFGLDAYEDILALRPDIQIAFDVGANIGQTVKKIRTIFPNTMIHSFEPVPETFEQLTRNVVRYSNVECYRCAIGEVDGNVEITVSETTGQNTISASAKPGVPRITVPTRTIESVCTDQGIDQIDVLKIDTEGYELSVLRGAQKMLTSGAVRFVLAECEFVRNPVEPHGNFFEIADFLLPLGYRVVAFYSGGVDGSGWVWGDVLFALPLSARPVSCSPFGRWPA